MHNTATYNENNQEVKLVINEPEPNEKTALVKSAKKTEQFSFIMSILNRLRSKNNSLVITKDEEVITKDEEIKASLSNLSDEILLKIMFYLPTEVFFSLATTNKKFFHLSQDHTFWPTPKQMMLMLNNLIYIYKITDHKLKGILKDENELIQVKQAFQVYGFDIEKTFDDKIKDSSYIDTHKEIVALRQCLLTLSSHSVNKLKQFMIFSRKYITAEMNSTKKEVAIERKNGYINGDGYARVKQYIKYMAFGWVIFWLASAATLGAALLMQNFFNPPENRPNFDWIFSRIIFIAVFLIFSAAPLPFKLTQCGQSLIFREEKNRDLLTQEKNDIDKELAEMRVHLFFSPEKPEANVTTNVVPENAAVNDLVL